MEEIPNLPEVTPADMIQPPEAVPEKAAEWLLEHEKNTQNKTDVKETTSSTTDTVLNYELDIAPGSKATVEIAGMSEADFDRRHEVMDEYKHTEPPMSGMVPLSQVLATHPSYQIQQKPDPTTPPEYQTPKTGIIRAVLRTPLYRKAVLSGVSGGIIILLAVLFMLTR